jgi:hypothetical protein
MADISAGTHSVQEILDAAGFDFNQNAAADYLNGRPDFRRVQIGGLAFDSLDDTIHIPVTADDVLITLDGKDHTVLDVTLDEDQRKERAYSFETAADADGPAKRTNLLENPDNKN